METTLQTVGPDSLTWKYFGDSRILFVIGQAFVLQISHPIIDAAIETQSTYKQDPWGRTRRSFKYLWPVVYSRPAEAVETGQFLRHWHSKIKGVSEQGVAYDAFDPEAYAWVHITAYDAMVRLAALIQKKPLTDTELDQLYDEWKVVGRLLGCEKESLPPDRRAYWDHYRFMIEKRLEYTDSADYWISRRFIQHLQPPFRWIPAWLWRTLMSPVSRIFDGILRVSLPDAYKQRFNISTTRGEECMFRFLVNTANLIWPILPLRLKYVPHAWQGVKDARQHPNAYAKSFMVS